MKQKQPSSRMADKMGWKRVYHPLSDKTHPINPKIFNNPERMMQIGYLYLEGLTPANLNIPDSLIKRKGDSVKVDPMSKIKELQQKEEEMKRRLEEMERKEAELKAKEEALLNASQEGTEGEETEEKETKRRGRPKKQEVVNG